MLVPSLRTFPHTRGSPDAVFLIQAPSMEARTEKASRRDKTTKNPRRGKAAKYLGSC